MSAEAQAICGAGSGEVSSEGTKFNSRNGYRAWELDTRAGTIELAVPKLRKDSYYPGWLVRARHWVSAFLRSSARFFRKTEKSLADDIVLNLIGSAGDMVRRCAQYVGRPLERSILPGIGRKRGSQDACR